MPSRGGGISVWHGRFPPSTHSSSPSTSRDGIRDLSSCGPAIEEDVLEAGHQGQSRGCTDQSKKFGAGVSQFVQRFPPTKRSRARSRSLEDTGWASLVRDWTQGERDLLRAAWRPSTLNTYCQPWQRWVQWASSQSIEFSLPVPGDVARFLAFLHSSLHLSPASIKLHKSVVCTWIRPYVSSTISSHPVVLRMIKGSQTSCPKQETRQIWNIDQLRQWIVDNPPDTASFFQVSRHVAMLLLLASGRRVHDQTLLHISKDHFQRIDSDITFCPAFGSKTDSHSSPNRDAVCHPICRTSYGTQFIG